MSMSEDYLPLLQKCNITNVSSLVHGLIDGLCGLSSPAYDDYSGYYSLEEWWNISEAVRILAKAAVRSDMDKDTLLKQLDSVAADHQMAAGEAILVRKEDIRRHLLVGTASISSQELQDFDWKVKLVMSSDKLGSIREPLATVDMVTKTDSRQGSASLELNKEELQKVISSLEAANRTLQTLK